MRPASTGGQPRAARESAITALVRELESATMAEVDGRGATPQEARQRALRNSAHVTPDQFKAGLAELRTELAESRAEQRTEIAAVRTEIASLETRLIRWMVGTVW